MKRQHATFVAAGLAACLLACGALSGCAGPSTRVLPRDVVGDQPYEEPEESQVLEEVNPFYLQESLDYLSGFIRESGTQGDEEAAQYIRQMLQDYGYETEIQDFYDGVPSLASGGNVVGIREPEYPNGDILILTANHDSLPGSPGANNNASGAASLLECARLLSRLPTDTEIRFISFSRSLSADTGSDYYVAALTEAEKDRIIGVVQLDTLGYVADSRIALGTADGRATLVGDLLRERSGEMAGLTSGWQYTLRDYGNHLPFIRNGIPAVVVSQAQEAYENGTPQDRPDIVNVDLLAGAVDIICHAAAGLMSADTPSQLAKSRYMSGLQEGVWVQRRDVRFPFGAGSRTVSAGMGAYGTYISSNVDGAGVLVDTYQYRMKWFDVDQIILTNYHYSDGKLETISLDADGAGVEFEEMKERIGSWYGEPSGENSGPAGIRYDWTDPLYHKVIALIPASDGFEVEIRDYTPGKTVLGRYRPDGTVLEETSADFRMEKLAGLARDIFPEEYGHWISQIAVYTDGVGDTACYLEAPGVGADPEAGTGPDLAVLWIDLEDAISEDGSWKNQTATVRMLAGCLGRLLELHEETGYLAAYRERFPTDGAEISAPGFAEDFARFVLFQKPAEIRDISDGRIQFFYNYGELVKLRTWIRGNLKIGDAAPED